MKEIMNGAKLLDIKEAVENKDGIIYLPDGSGESFLKLCAWDGRTADRGGDPIFDNYDGTPSVTRTMKAENLDWQVCVIEIASLFASTDYQSDDATVTRAVFGIKGDSTGNNDDEDGGVNDYVDIAYFAVCDDWKEVASVTAGEQSVIFTAWSDASYDEIRTPNGTLISK